MTMTDAPPGGHHSPPQAGANPHAVPQLPPQMFTTAAQLLDLTDTNIVLQSTTERIFAPNAGRAAATDPYGYFADVAHGIFLVRGENVLLLGEIDLDRDDDPPAGYEPAELDVVKRMAEQKKAADKAKEKHRLKKLAKIGFEGENLGDIFF
ncbi:Sm-like protein LSm1 [Escovopsis weberi]|uniref:Sm-like protein LSm1 n=1 Tax=Escovopsis weberi TaxID=150374 RepID=A0A0M8N6U0_ESCWE|nr:Sm-like protein LSm1 [Escovopsis weberi]